MARAPYVPNIQSHVHFNLRQKPESFRHVVRFTIDQFDDLLNESVELPGVDEVMTIRQAIASPRNVNNRFPPDVQVLFGNTLSRKPIRDRTVGFSFLTILCNSINTWPFSQATRLEHANILQPEERLFMFLAWLSG